MADITWRISSYSGQNNNCVEFAELDADRAAVRDSKDRGGPLLTFPGAAFAAFTAGVRAGDFE
jgi:hypothetical protein